MSVYTYPSDTGVNLTQLYSDAKKSAPSQDIQDNVTSALSDLHTEFAFQQTRLDGWGVQWSEEGKGPDGNIDETLARAGFTETATSVLENILDLNKEAANIRASDASGTQAWAAGGPEKKSAIPTIDMSRYTDLIQDLTNAIDILYEISRNRRVHIAGKSHDDLGETSTEAVRRSESTKSLHGEEGDSKSVRFTSFEPTFYDSHKHSASRRLGTPHAIDPSALILPPEGPPPYQNAGVALTTRMIGRLFRWQAPEPVRISLQEYLDDPLVLVEYAPFDPLHLESGVPPPLHKLEQLAGYLQQVSSQPQLNLLGYFQDPQTARLGLIYDITDCFSDSGASEQQEFENVEQRSLLHLLQAASKTSKTADSLAATPPLEDRFRLAFRVAKHMEYMHSAAFTHENLTSDSVLFVTDAHGRQQPSDLIQTPVIGSFDLFSSPIFQAHADESGSNIYKYPDSYEPADDLTSRLKRDIYGLGLILLEIGLWTPLSDLHKSKYQLADFKARLEKIWIPRLSVKCGSAYMNAVQACFNFSDSIGSTMLVARHYDELINQLRRCCLICDDDGASYSRPDSRQSYAPSAVDSGYHSIRSRGKSPRQQSVSSAQSRRSSRYMSRSPSSRATGPQDWLHTIFNDGYSFREVRSSAVTIQRSWRLWKEQKADRASRGVPSPSAERQRIETQDLTSRTTQPKQRVFPCRLNSEQLADWHSNLALRISHIVERALKGSRESSTIELINVGTDEATSKPTILITCASTTLVKTAVKRRFRCDTDVYNIKVRKGGVNLSHKSGTPEQEDDKSDRRRNRTVTDESATRSLAADKYYDSDDTELEARNPFFHERPVCGSSIGAYHEDLGHQDACTFGGIVLIDGQPFGMSVHHMLGVDDVESESGNIDSDADNSFADDESEPESEPELVPVTSVKKPDSPAVRRSSARPRTGKEPQSKANKDATAPPLFPSSDEEDVESDSDVAFLESSAEDSDNSSSDIELLGYTSEPDSDEEFRPSRPQPAGPIESVGDTRGYRPSSTLTRAWRITQPSLDDAVDQDLHELDQDQLEIDDDHLREYTLGSLYASSGLRRHRDGAGFAQEMDWALFSIDGRRLHRTNVVRGVRLQHGAARQDVPLAARVPALAEFPGADVFAAGRTSGLAAGRVHPARVRMKVEDRADFCWSWMVVPDGGGAKGAPPLGASGDSGAWIVDRRGRAVGVVLAHASRSGVTYFCPMELVLEDVRRWLAADGKKVSVELPGFLERTEVSPPERMPRRSNLVLRKKLPPVPQPGVGMRSHAGGVRWQADAVPI